MQRKKKKKTNNKNKKKKKHLFQKGENVNGLIRYGDHTWIVSIFMEKQNPPGRKKHL